MLRRLFRLTYRAAWRLMVLWLGTTVLLIGVALVVLPGPALLVIPLGLAILALEFAWARRLLRRLVPRSGPEDSDSTSIPANPKSEER